MNDFPVFSIDVANYLMSKGFKMKRVKPNINTPGYLMFYFEQSKSIETAIWAYKKQEYKKWYFTKEFTNYVDNRKTIKGNGIW